MSPDAAPSGSTWFEQPELLEREVRKAYSTCAPVPEIAGYGSLIEIARGGQGVVYRAVQLSTRRPVALKVLRDIAPRDDERRRFEREVDLAASLRHPNIVAIYDSGATADGRPFLVMEFVEGSAIDDHLRAGGDPPVRGALALLAQVCDAVAHAHQRGVIHRDIKPSNIRVDTEGHARVLDFGLARAAGDRAMTFSVSGRFVGSLPWASPEQAEGRSADTDTRSDVYALGVVLYQLLTGGFPYDVEGSMRTSLEQIVSAPPARPSAKRPDIDDELETVILKCLAKEPDRRYQSGAELGRDIRRYLAGEPVEAKRDSAWYTVRKRLVRYRLATIGASVAAVGATAALLAVNGYRLETSRQRDLAQDALAEARDINTFMEETFTAVTPSNLGIDTTLREVLGVAAGEVDSRFAERPKVRQSVHMFLGNTYWGLGELDRAADHLASALDLQRETLGPDDPTTIDTECNLGAVLADLQRYDEAETALADAFERSTRTLGPEHEKTITIRHNQAYLYHAMGRLQDAEAIYRETLALERRVLGPDAPETLTTANSLAPLLWELGKTPEAADMFREVAAARERTLGPDDPSTLLSRQNLAQCLSLLGHLRQAAEIQRRCADDFQRVLGDKHPWTISNAGNLASTLLILGHPAEAETRCRDLLAMLDETHEEDHDAVLRARLLLAQSLVAQDRAPETLPMLREAADTFLATYGQTDRRTLSAQRTLADALAGAGDTAQAESLLRQAIDTYDQLPGPPRAEAAGARLALANLARDLQRPDAIDLYRDALHAAEVALPDHHWVRAAALQGVGRCLDRQGHTADALPMLRDAHAKLRDALGEDHERTTDAAADLAAAEARGAP